MTYDEQRRELAERLRDFESARSFASDKVTGRIGSIVEANELMLELFGDACSSRFGCVEFVDSCALLHLAYLIDCHTCRNVSEDQGVFECGECGYIIILDSPYGEPGPIKHCPGCGGTVIDDDRE